MNDKIPLIDLIRTRLEAGDVELPVFDNIAIEIHREARENRLDAEGICKILEKDTTLVSEVLRMANSSFFSGLAEVRSLRDACVRLGVKQIAAIVFSVSAKRLYSASKGPFKSRLLRLWQHATAVSIGARWVATRAGYRNLNDEAFVAGLLHDVGKLSLLRIIEDIAKDTELGLNDTLVDMTLAHLHCEHGARLLEIWNVPTIYRDVVVHLEDDQVGDSQLTLAIVRLVDKACALEGISDLPDPTIALESLPEVALLGISDIDVAELRLLLEDMKSGDSAQAAA